MKKNHAGTIKTSINVTVKRKQAKSKHECTGKRDTTNIISTKIKRTPGVGYRRLQ